MIKLILLLASLVLSVNAKDTFTPISDPANLPKTAIALWNAYDARKEPLEVKIIKEWKTKEITTRYITYKVGRFKGVDSRVAAYYSFPNLPGKHPAFVWTHGGGQRAERSRSIHFASQGFACIDVNWLGRSMEQDIEINTDWGKIDPSQGPKFYPKALRNSWKHNLQPDEFTIDPIPSPRNANWFLLTMSARRAITFLEQQPEVKVDSIGFTGFSMGGMITALTSIDKRLKAVAPFVGGTGFKYIDFPGGMSGSSQRHHFKDLEMYKNTIDPQAYWPNTTCPVAFITSSNDFHSTFERIYRSMDLLKHENWRVTSNIHYNHGPGHEQWALLTLWFKKYLAQEKISIPATPPSTFLINQEMANFSVSPQSLDRLVNVEIYYSYDPNSRTRFWHQAKSKKSGDTWSASISVFPKLPLYTFALCRYKMNQEMTLQNGSTKTYTLNSKEGIHEPKEIDLKELIKLKRSGLVDDFANGIADWSSRNGGNISTYKFQSPFIDRSNDKVLALSINPQGRDHTLRLRFGSGFLGRGNSLGNFNYHTKVSGKGPQQILIDRKEIKGDPGKVLEWAKISTFSVTLVDNEKKQVVRLSEPTSRAILKKIELIDRP